MSADYQSSNNPFRRKAAASSAPANPNPAPPSSSTTHSHEPFSYHRPSEPTAAAPTDPKPPEQRTKPVKRVRVQTPPPLSSDSESDASEAPSPAWRRPEGQDPFGGVTEEARDDTQAQSGPPRRNPFSKTLQDIEPGRDSDGARASGRTAGRASLDVAAFQRLLLTGQSGANNPGPGPSEAPSTHPHSPTRPTESSSSSPSSRSSALDAPQNQSVAPAPSEPPRTTHRTSPPHDDPLPAPQKQRPPPPSSRHGKAINLRVDLDRTRYPAPPTPPLARTPSDFNKPLPVAPARTPSEEDAESIFDREAAGRAPESPGPPSPAVSTHEYTGGTMRRTPAPPPRRRQDGGQDQSPPVHNADLHRRMSVDSTHSRTDSIRAHAPAPPPPRRPNHRSTPSLTSLTSPSSQSFSIPAVHDTSHPSSPRGFPAADAPAKHAPRPPPARNPSTRRKTSGGSVEGQPKRAVSRDGISAPPPPPRRQRGGSGSRESLDFSETSRRGDAGAVGMLREEDERLGNAGSASAGADEWKADDGQAGVILADLGALQREVEALQRQYESSRG